MVGKKSTSVAFYATKVDSFSFEHYEQENLERMENIKALFYMSTLSLWL